MDHQSYARKFLRLTKPARFYFLRHGESEGNRNNTIQGHHDYPLSELGREHARAAGAWLSDKSVDLIYTSPLERTRETAELVREQSPETELRETRDLMELDTGLFSGHSFDEIASRFPEAWQVFRVESWESVPGAEPIASLYGRAERHWWRIVEDANAGHTTVVSVTHGGILQWIVKTTLGDQNQRWMPIIKGSNCGIFLLTVRPVNYDPSKPIGGDPSDGYFAEWTLLNHIPYGPDGASTPRRSL
jgi:broad specificity phosphatase PhoE